LTYLIAECGINHNGDMAIAKRMIKDAQEAGFDAVKFQMRTIDKVYSQAVLDSPRESPWGTTTRQQKEGLEFSHDQYREIDAYCRELGIDWSASCWDTDSQAFLRTLNVPFNKVASPMLGNWPLLRMIAEEGKPTYISTGMSTLAELDKVYGLFMDEECPFTLLHCNSTYPMPEEDANLLCITTLHDRYRCYVGYSGHETSLLKVCTAAVVLGATAIERHITLDRSMYGSDQSASIETHALRNFVQTIRAIPSILGTGKKDLLLSEIPIRNKLRIDAQ